MAFNNKYKSLSEVITAYDLIFGRADFGFVKAHAAPEVLKEDIRFTLDNVAYEVSEAAICENLIYPVLKAAWRPFASILSIWSHQSLGYDTELSGIPDYVISKRSERGVIVFEEPHIAVIEAKKDDFTAGWAQCGVEMVAIQKINQTIDIPVFGIVSNGETWEFAELSNNQFTLFRQRFDINELDILFAALISILERCKTHLTVQQK
ncbi:MAG: hypothetical protein EAZ32_00225 [Cytophagia bacterium]|nr:MAG: hypothetical protein EAZ46_08970 [Runella sp.]TAG23758.1 MAG: hypothetical protein EAZ38_02680 [Cytophagales bacterium]TAG43119.1 MAG: hypothetical protein EAZ32_00225 [Cytophagia bacterium]TAG74474.1 MAG: hypothetical protein EAZ26_02010 [Runella slithyformis]TAG76521.1 MAG: hypothetical protein EAZ22_17910 [Cytophagales bacterium]